MFFFGVVCRTQAEYYRTIIMIHNNNSNNHGGWHCDSTPHKATEFVFFFFNFILCEHNLLLLARPSENDITSTIATAASAI